jgi:hypothetical protein
MSSLEEVQAPKYYRVRLPKWPVLVNAYTLVGDKLVNVNPDDTSAEQEDPAAGIQITPNAMELTYEGAWYDCVHFPREFTDGLFYAIVNGSDRGVLAKVHRERGESDALRVIGAADEIKTIEIEQVRRGKWATRSLYHLPGGGADGGADGGDLWVRSGNTLGRYMPLGEVDPRGKISFSDQAIIEESYAKKQAAVKVLRGEGHDRSYFVECEHGLVDQLGWVVTLRKIDGDETALGYKTPLGVRLLDQTQTQMAVESLAAGATSQEKSATAATAATAADALRNAGGRALFGSLQDASGKVMSLIIGGKTHQYAIRWFDRGSYNRVGVASAVEAVEAAQAKDRREEGEAVEADRREEGGSAQAQAQGVIIRLSYGRHPTLAQFEREARFATEIGRRGIGPEIYATLYVGEHRGFAMERFPYTLYDVIECPTLMRQAFVEADGESAVVSLYMRSSALIRCVDTKPANVVVRFDPLRLALIDVDPQFCSEQPYAAPHETFGDALDALDAALTSKSSLFDAAATSLLVHCIEAAHPSRRPFGFGYPRVARCLLKHMAALWPLIERPAMRVMRRYYHQNRNKSTEITESMVTERLEEAVEAGYLIELCRGTAVGMEGPEGPHGALYERAAMVFSRGGSKPSLKLVRSAESLVLEVENQEQDAQGPPLGCKLDGCKLHPQPTSRTKKYREDEGPDLTERPDLPARPDRTERPDLTDRTEGPDLTERPPGPETKFGEWI